MKMDMLDAGDDDDDEGEVLIHKHMHATHCVHTEYDVCSKITNNTQCSQTLSSVAKTNIKEQARDTPTADTWHIRRDVIPVYNGLTAMHRIRNVCFIPSLFLYYYLLLSYYELKEWHVVGIQEPLNH